MFSRNKEWTAYFEREGAKSNQKKKKIEKKKKKER